MVEGGASLLKITKLIGLGGEVGEQRPKKGNGRDWGQTNFAKKNLQRLELAIYFGHSLFQALVTNIVAEWRSTSVLESSMQKMIFTCDKTQKFFKRIFDKKN